MVIKRLIIICDKCKTTVDSKKSKQPPLIFIDGELCHKCFKKITRKKKTVIKEEPYVGYIS